MKSKLLLLVTLVSLTNPCLAYNDYGYSYGTSSGYSGGFDSSMHVREIQNDAARQFELNAASSAALHNSLNNSYQKREQEYQPQPSSQPTYNPNRNYVQDKPLCIFGR